ncbi:uncharacterized protein GLRG_03469 [Colletotrichum graminicola M1.001]|uniref:Uncharacterized protein n=1 Tax=Colletotrichum graminicola (strain M1.001 / M2 / FGSC 10212) TaxID=645133 RepID=E3QBI6_COLGM|nr:uncharacterized protein GLRG_03469 [Colletotrichum graminicola M1.001]EFQ28325.1 hypothetical protein GLRG_03469 [Colletotrichum graminicola M1.001]
MADSQPPALHGRPRATPYRFFVRLRDRLELVLERFVDGDPTAQAGFERYKADRDRRWAERDARRMRKKKKKEKKVTAAAVAISVINGPTDETPVGDAASPGMDNVFPQNHADEETGLDAPKTGDKGKDKGKDNAPCQGDDDDDDDVGRAPGAAGGSTARRHTDAPPRGTQRSGTFSSLVGSTLGEQGRRKRKRPYARPGYFDPDPFPQGPSCGTDATVAEVGVGDEDRLEMNIPVELGRRSWTVPIGTAR